MGLQAVKAPEQQGLDLGPAPEWEDMEVDLAMITDATLGAPPEDEFTASVGMYGVIHPVLLEENAANGFAIIDGRRRVAAARKGNHVSVPARVMRNGNADLHPDALLLASNDPRSTNPIMELDAIENLLRHNAKLTAPQIARGVGMKLKTVKARMKLVPLLAELREGARASKMNAKVVEAAARCNEDQQRELITRLQANDKLTMDDVREVKKTHVREHQRSLPGENWKARARKALKDAEGEVFLNAGKCEAHEKIKAALDALDELDD